MSEFKRAIHLLYVPTLCCNLSCDYCYLGEQTTSAALKQDARRALATLDFALAELEAAGVLAFNVSLHGGEVTTLPPVVLEALFVRIRQHYLQHFDQLNALGHKKSAPHIKTNLYKFAPLYELFVRHKVSISASIDLPLKQHALHRKTRSGQDWLARTLENLRLLAKYPYGKKISATLCAEHLADIPALIADIWFIHRELGFDMNQFNIMFAFDSSLAREAHGALNYASEAQQLELYQALKTEFIGTELEEGFLRNWFDEFTPNYCTNMRNCGEKFYLLQSDGKVYSCVRGQGLDEFYYGNIFEQGVLDILQTGADKVRQVHQQMGFDTGCQQCQHLSLCHSGCPVVKLQQQRGRSYTCALQKAIYQDNPRSYPVASIDYAPSYARLMHPASPLAKQAPAPTSFVIPPDFNEAKNSLQAQINADPVLTSLFSDQAFVLSLNEEVINLSSQLLKTEREWHVLSAEDSLILHFRREIFEVACPEKIRNTLYLQLLRDTKVVYGDEQRTKQEHIFTYQLYANCLQTSQSMGPDYLQFDLRNLFALHQDYFLRGVLNNLFITTFFLREYHYNKQKNNAFYHVQTANLPFQNFEFFYLS